MYIWLGVLTVLAIYGARGYFNHINRHHPHSGHFVEDTGETTEGEDMGRHEIDQDGEEGR